MGMVPNCKLWLMPGFLIQGHICALNPWLPVCYKWSSNSHWCDRLAWFMTVVCHLLQLTALLRQNNVFHSRPGNFAVHDGCLNLCVCAWVCMQVSAYVCACVCLCVHAIMCDNAILTVVKFADGMALIACLQKRGSRHQKCPASLRGVVQWLSKLGSPLCNI